MNNIYLIGMMGSGKSTIGNLLAKRLNLSFIDIDTLIEQEKCTSISQIFTSHGELVFRQLEADALRRVSAEKDCVIATGGGIVLSSDNVEVMKKTGTVILLDRPLSDIANDVELSNRPLLKDGSEVLLSIYDKREKLYKNAAQFTISGSITVEEAVGKIVLLIKSDS